MPRLTSTLGALGAAIVLSGITTGCATTVKPVNPQVPTEITELDRGYATLASLLGDERKVHQILPLKSEGLPVRLLTQDIASTSAKADDELKNMSGLAPALNLKQPTDLPMIEQATRDSITTETALDLLFSNETFETRLMLSQGQALRYGRFLALKLKDADPNKDRQAWLATVASEYERLYKDVVNELQKAQPDKPAVTSTTKAE